MRLRIRIVREELTIHTIVGREMGESRRYGLEQGLQTDGPRAACGPRDIFFVAHVAMK
jgi:hypothetical protein